MSGVTVLVVDDEPLARGRIVRLLNKMEWIGRIDEAGDVVQACASADANSPDILLLDVQMPGGNGFEVLQRVAKVPPVVIFVTAFDHHAVRAFEANAIDYVTKPIEPGRLILAMERARNALVTQSNTERIAELEETIIALRSTVNSQTRPPSDFWVKRHGDYLRLPPESILRFQADRDYVRIHVQDGDYLYHESLATLERRLEQSEFLRIHRSTIVRRGAIARVRSAPFSALIAVLSDGSEIRVGRTYAPTVRAALGRL